MVWYSFTDLEIVRLSLKVGASFIVYPTAMHSIPDIHKQKAFVKIDLV